MTDRRDSLPCGLVETVTTLAFLLVVAGAALCMLLFVFLERFFEGRMGSPSHE
jgi:hypothetical protein